MNSGSSSKPKLLILLGPTACGKSSLAIQIAKLYPGTEIVSADSRLLYKYMNIGTAKPSGSELSETRHHMIDIVEPSSHEYSLGKYIQEASPLVLELGKKNKLVILVGGTGFYIDGITGRRKLNQAEADPELRSKLEGLPNEHLFRLLQEKSLPREIHMNDRFRMIRALEQKEENSQDFLSNCSLEANFDLLWVGLRFASREHHQQIIKKRVEHMLDNGLVSETKALVHKYGKLDLFTKTIGYKECLAYIQGELQSLDELKSSIVIATRQYAKRQNTYFKTNKQIHWLDWPAKSEEDQESDQLDFSAKVLAIQNLIECC
jgi:tRNA dimethylallyltransferase